MFTPEEITKIRANYADSIRASQLIEKLIRLNLTYVFPSEKNLEVPLGILLKILKDQADVDPNFYEHYLEPYRKFRNNFVHVFRSLKEGTDFLDLLNDSFWFFTSSSILLEAFAAPLRNWCEAQSKQ